MFKEEKKQLINMVFKLQNIFFKIIGKDYDCFRSNFCWGNDKKSFFYKALEYQNRAELEGWGAKAGNYYEFGVGWGGSLLTFIESLKAYSKHSNQDMYSYHIFGFDSFQGLPEKQNENDNHGFWKAGLYSHSVMDIKKLLLDSGFDIQKNNINLIEGFFENSLTESLRTELKENCPSIVTIDCDYYSSTKTVLEWLRPLLSSGTIFYFDDIWEFHGNPEYGELAAINEFNLSDRGKLIPFRLLGDVGGRVYIYYNKEYEYGKQKI